MLQAGYAKLDVTPPLGIALSGYYENRFADGILDPLYTIAVAFDDGSCRAVVISLDNHGLNQHIMNQLRSYIANQNSLPREAVFISCTCTHQGPVIDINSDLCEEYFALLKQKLSAVVSQAFADLAPAALYHTDGHVEKVAFTRRFRMKDGSVQTNPGLRNPEIQESLGKPDEQASLLIIKREGKPEIGIINFQVQPDVISGCKISADYPQFVRYTYEALIDHSLCMYINGTSGNINHIDVSLSEQELYQGYARSRYMGRKIAFAVAGNYDLARRLDQTDIAYGQKNIMVKYNKGRPDQIEKASYINRLYETGGRKAVSRALQLPDDPTGMKLNEITAESMRIMNLLNYPPEKELYLTAVTIGDVAFAGFPGEPFAEVGAKLKKLPGFRLVIPAECTNGYEGYYPVMSAFFEGGYEIAAARYQAGTAEKLIDASTELLTELRRQRKTTSAEQ